VIGQGLLLAAEVGLAFLAACGVAAGLAMVAVAVVSIVRGRVPALRGLSMFTNVPPRKAAVLFGTSGFLLSASILALAFGNHVLQVLSLPGVIAALLWWVIGSWVLDRQIKD
jgi:hypothetical protein